MAVHRVLVVDDNHEIRRMVTASIKTLGVDVDVLDVPSAEEALFISSSLPLDLIVLDFRLPGMSGLEMVNWLRKRMPETKIILVTGVEDATTRQQIAEAGVAAYFFKPIEIATFLDAARRCLWVDAHEAALPSTIRAGEESADRKTPAESPTRQPAPAKLESKLDVRLTALKGQLRASSVLLVNEMGQVMEVAGNPAQLTSSSVLLPTLMEAFHASQKVSAALGKDLLESLHYFTIAKQRIYLAPVNTSNALLLVTLGLTEQDKQGMFDRAIHRAVCDLRDILEGKKETESLQPGMAGVELAELPAEVVVDPDTLASVAEMFSQASKTAGKEEAEGFWEVLGEKDQLDTSGNKDVLSYDQARDMGLAPDDSQKP
jgi:DNA-binding response OmpR family regulator